MNTNTKEKRPWESLGDSSERLRVPGGWVVRSWYVYDGVSIHQVYVPDPQHEWILEP